MVWGWDTLCKQQVHLIAENMTMNHKHIVIIVILSSLLFSGMALAKDKKTIGVGIGALYNGLGLSYGIQKLGSFKYISLGCLNISNSSSRGTETNCGLGLGFVRTGVGNRHGLGAHIGATYNEHRGLNKIEMFIAPQYIYFLNGIDDAGLNLGAFVSFGNRDGDFKIRPGLQIGYQF